MSPPPGWYPDPSAPHLQRWWDGTAWTEHRSTPTVPVQTPAGGGGSGRAKVVALATAGVVLVAAIVTGAVYLRNDDDAGGADVQTVPNSVESSAPPTTGGPSPSVSASEPSADDPAVVVDQLNGITLPLPDGWVRPQYVAEDDVVMTTHGTYGCPGDSGVCRHGLVISRTATDTDESSPKALAEQDIPDAADAAYDRDLIGGRPFGGIESHRRVKSGQIAVAGRAGYFVRWRVTTAKGPGGYVESLVFPSSVGTEAPVIVRFVFDAGADGPPLADMDRITKGIRPLDDASTSGGVGSSIGPRT
ncbi:MULTISPECIES: DUF2510 domain-containing protein [unclassified Streptomyces]|uniref:DUF2510 domain-containing protein n=1 Tax=unclassified Streptomyces TaxID=2593676 RepID=UPI002254AD29|nr:MULTISPECIES: DUF2510 domain-containing protein [unclassified Streptomyces]MCX5046917.1 DUF2510 domain-containing protein [Streptomyces sp. NBC_00474]